MAINISGSFVDDTTPMIGNLDGVPHFGIQGPTGPQGPAGGHYTPSVTQPNTDTLEFQFTPSKPDMPAVDPVQVELPHSGGNVDQEQITAAVNEALAEAKASGEFDGADGKDGVDGKDGQDGYTPQKGIDYFDGQPGKDGVDGKDGYTPVKGVDYFDGNPGKDGQPGEKGETGSEGPQGPQGPQGQTGPEGPQGIQGEPGEKGEQGIPGEKGESGVYILSAGETIEDAPADADVVIDPNGEAVEIPEGGGGVSSWNDLTDRPFYSEYQKSTIYSGADLTPDPDMGMIVVNESIPLIVGQEYTVKWNGVDYACVCIQTDTNVFVLGNMAVAEGEDTGEPFCIISYTDQGMTIVAPLDGSESATVSITGNVETVHEMDKKYIENALEETKAEMRFYADDYLHFNFADVDLVYDASTGTARATTTIDSETANRLKEYRKLASVSLSVNGIHVIRHCIFDRMWKASGYIAHVFLTDTISEHNVLNMPVYLIRITVTLEGSVNLNLEQY